MSQAGGDGEATCEVGSNPLLAMPSDRATVVGLGCWGVGRAMRALVRAGPKVGAACKQDFGGDLRVEAIPCLRVSRCP